MYSTSPNSKAMVLNGTISALSLKAQDLGLHVRKTEEDGCPSQSTQFIFLLLSWFCLGPLWII